MNVKKNSLVCFTGIIDQESLYTFNNRLSLIMKYDLKDFSYEIVGELQNYMISHDPVIRMIMFEENLYLVLFRRRGIVRFNITKKNPTECFFSKKILAPNELIWGAFMYKSHIWEFSVSAGCKIYSFNCVTGEHQEYCSVKELFKKKNLLIEADDYFSNMFQIHNEVWSAVCGTPYVFCLNLDEMGLTVFHIGCEEINSFDYDGRDFWITVPGDSAIINWSPEDGILNCFNVSEINFRDYPSCYISGTDDRVFVIPNSDKDFCCINKKTREYKFLSFVGSYQKLSPDKNVYPVVYPFGGYIRTSDILILLPRNIDKIIVIDLQYETITYVDSALKKEDYERMYVKNKLYTGGLEETRDYKLTDYTEHLNKDIFNLDRKEKDKNIGRKIFTKM
ncbi:MAG: hypothetical protein K1W10_14450 [Lachnospiraceae bacterium]